MNAQTSFDTLLTEAQNWHTAIPELLNFNPWPTDLSYTERSAISQPALPHLIAMPGAPNNQSTPLQQALLAVIPYAEWRVTYTEEDVGRDFLNRFAWFELAGPTGHFHSSQTRMTVGYWGPNLYYDWHQHAPDEVYSVVSGCADFLLEDAETLPLGPGNTRYHPSEQRHALRTHNAPVLTFVLWRGAGLSDDPRMSS